MLGVGNWNGVCVWSVNTTVGLSGKGMPGTCTLLFTMFMVVVSLVFAK